MSDPCFRQAREGDLPAIVALLADDALGAARERVGDTLPPAYHAAFVAIDVDPNQFLLVGEVAGAVMACLQLTFLPGLSHLGAWRAQIESVRVARGARGRRLGERMIAHAIALARQRRCRIVQLTTDKTRRDAQRFYERIGFIASHEGMKLHLD